MNHEIERYEGELRLLRESNKELLSALQEIEQAADEAARLGVKRCKAIRECASAAIARAKPAEYKEGP